MRPRNGVVVFCAGPSAASSHGCDRSCWHFLPRHTPSSAAEKLILFRIIPTPLLLLVGCNSDSIELSNAKACDGGACKGEEPRSREPRGQANAKRRWQSTGDYRSRV